MLLLPRQPVSVTIPVQRTAAARAHVVEPELLVVDDLSSALDMETERAVWERLSARGELTVLAISHRPAALRKADQIVVLKHGRVSDSGTLTDLLDRCEDFRRIWDQVGEPMTYTPSREPQPLERDGVQFA